MKRKILIVVVLFSLAVVGIIVSVFSSLDTLIQEAVEQYGSEITKAEVRLDKVEINISSGEGSLSGLTVGNPKGFETPSAFKLRGIKVSLDTATVTRNPVIIKEVVIGFPEVTYELGSGGSNIDAIQNNVNAYMAKFGDSRKGDTDNEGARMIIEHLYVRGGTVNVSASILKGKTLSAPLPDIHLKDIGKKEGGATPSEVAEKLLTSFSKSTYKAVSSIGIGKTLDSLRKNLSGLGKGLTKDVGGAADSISNSVNEGAAAAGNKIKGLLGR